MIVGPHNIDKPTLRSIRLVNSNPRLIAKNLVCPAFKDVYRISERLTSISGFRNSYATLSPRTSFIKQNRRVDIIVIAKGETNVGGSDVLVKSRQNTAIVPGTTAIERTKISNLKGIMGRVSKEFRATNQVQWILWILREHRFTMSK